MSRTTLPLLFAVFFAGIALCGPLARDALASGGAYRGPIGEIPPGRQKDRGPPLTKKSDGAPPRIPGPVKPEGPGPSSESYDLSTWVFWWHAAKDEFLRARAPVARRPEGIAEVSKALRKAIANREIHPAIRAAAVLALARAADEMKVEEILARALDSKEVGAVRCSAMIGLAILGKTEALDPVVDDPKASGQCRSFAMFAMGLDRHRPGGESMAAILADGKLPLDLRCDAAFALGLRGLVCDELLGLDREGPAPLRIRAVEALARIPHDYGRAVTFSQYAEEPACVRRSRILALGKRSWTKEIYFREEETDHLALGFTTISMGRKGHTAALRRHWEERPRLRGYLALALAVAGDRTMIPTFRDALADTKIPYYRRGAFAIALGLLGVKDEETTALLASMLNDKSLSRSIRRSVATALGMTKSPAAKKALLARLADRKDRGIHRAVVEGLACLSGRELAPAVLAGVFDNPKSNIYAGGAGARALGNWKDPKSIAKLVAILEPDKINGEYPDITRMFAAEALGLIYERRGTGLLLQVTRDLNYRTTTPALRELLTYQ